MKGWYFLKTSTTMSNASPPPEIAVAVMDAFHAPFRDENWEPLSDERVSLMLRDHMRELSKLAKEGNVSDTQLQWVRTLT